jgi:hypothetical protein
LNEFVFASLSSRSLQHSRASQTEVEEVEREVLAVRARVQGAALETGGEKLWITASR